MICYHHGPLSVHLMAWTIDGSRMSFFSDNMLGNFYVECSCSLPLSDKMLPSYDSSMFPSMPCESLGTSNLVPDGGIMNMVSEVQPGNLYPSKQIVASRGLSTFQSMLGGSFSTSNFRDICSTPDVGIMNMEPEYQLENLCPSKHILASSGFSTFLNASNVDIHAAPDRHSVSLVSEIPPEYIVSRLDSSSFHQIPPIPSVPYAPFNALNYLDLSSIDGGTMGVTPEYPISNFYSRWCDTSSPVSQMVASCGLASSQVFPVFSNVLNATEENASATPECIRMSNRMESSHCGGDGIVFEQTNDFNHILSPNGGRSLDYVKMNGVHQECAISDVAKHWGSRPFSTMGMSRRSLLCSLPPDRTFNTSGATTLIVSKSVSDGAEVANLVGQQTPQITKEDANLRPTQNHINVVGKTSAENSKKKSDQTRGQKANHVSTKKGNNVMMKAGVKNSEPLCTKQRKLRSEVWKGFIRVEEADGRMSATCKHCKHKFDGSSKNGTSHLRDHLKRCLNRRNGDKCSNEIPKAANLTTVAGIKDKYMVDEEPSHLDLEQMILKHESTVRRSIDILKEILQVCKEKREELRRYSASRSTTGPLHVQSSSTQTDGPPSYNDMINPLSQSTDDVDKNSKMKHDNVKMKVLAKTRTYKSKIYCTPYEVEDSRKRQKVEEVRQTFKPFFDDTPQTIITRLIKWISEADNVEPIHYTLEEFEVDRDFFRLLLGDGSRWLNTLHVDILSYIIRTRIEATPYMKQINATFMDHTWTQSWLLGDKDLSEKCIEYWSSDDQVIRTVCGDNGLNRPNWKYLDKVYLPINIPNRHWFLAEMDIQSCTIRTFDSLRVCVSEEEHNSIMAEYRTAIKRIMKSIGYLDKANNEWPIRRETIGVNQQSDGSDCGMFMIKFAEHLIHGVSIEDTVKVEYMQAYRKLWAHVVYRVLINLNEQNV